MKTDKYPDYVGIFTFLSRAFLVLIFLMGCFILWRAILWLRDRKNLDEVEDIEGLNDPWDQAISRPAADIYWGPASGGFGGEMGGLGSMNQREQEELFSTYAPRKVRKEMQRRRRAREQARKHESSVTRTKAPGRKT